MNTHHLIRSCSGPVLAGLLLLGCAGSPDAAPEAPAWAGGEFAAMTTMGEEISGETLRGHVTIVDFWAVF